MADKKRNPWLVAGVGLACVIVAIIATIVLATTLDISSSTANSLNKLIVPIILLSIWAYRSWRNRKNSAGPSN